MSENNDLAGNIGIRDVDVVKRQLQQANNEVELLTDKLEKINVDFDEEYIVGEVNSNIDQPEAEKIFVEPEFVEPDFDLGEQENILPDKFQVHKMSTKSSTDVNPSLTYHNIIDPPQNFSNQKNIEEENIDKFRPDLGETVPLTEETKTLISKKIHGEVMFMTPEEFINLASPTQFYEPKIKELNEKIFNEGFNESTLLPFFYVNLEKNIITGHEGRHRAMAAHLEQLKTGKTIKIPVSISKEYSNDPIENMEELVLNMSSENNMRDGIKKIMDERGEFRPELTSDMSLRQYNSKFENYNFNVRMATSTFEREENSRKFEERRLKNKIANEFDRNVWDKILDRSFEIDREFDMPREDFKSEINDFLIEIGYVNKENIELEGGAVRLSEYITLDGDKVIFDKKITDNIGPELLKSIIDTTEDLPSNLEFEFPDVNDDEYNEYEEEDKKYFLTPNEQRQLANDINESIINDDEDFVYQEDEDELMSLDDEEITEEVSYKGDISSKVNVKSIEDIINKVLDD